MRPLQVVLSVPDAPRLVAGVPLPVRAAAALCGGVEADRVIFCAPSRSFLAQWGRRLQGLPWLLASADGEGRPLRELLCAEAPALVLSCEAFPDEAAVREFLGRAGEAVPTALSDGKAVVAAYYPQASALRAALSEDGRRVPEAVLSATAKERSLPINGAAGGWRIVRGAEDAARIEAQIFRSLPRAEDGYLARLDRRLSMAVSRLLLPLPVTPNQVTTLSLLVGLAGAALLAGPSYPLQSAGAFLLWSCCVLDGCDGELARLKLLSSEAGARYDVLADNAVHLAVFIAVPLQIRRLHPDADVVTPGILLLSGFLLSAFWVWRLILRGGREPRGPSALVFERLASRDFIYLIVLLTLLRRLEWFLWAAAVGSHLFWLAVVALQSRPRRVRAKA